MNIFLSLYKLACNLTPRIRIYQEKSYTINKISEYAFFVANPCFAYGTLKILATVGALTLRDPILTLTQPNRTSPPSPSYCLFF